MKRLYFYILFLVVGSSSFAQDKQQLPALQQKLSAAKNDSVKEAVLTEIVNFYFTNHEYAQALSYALQALQLREKLGNKKEIAKILNSIGNIYANTKNLPDARNYWLRSISILEEISDTSYMRSDVLENTGLGYLVEYNYPKAREFYEKALTVSQLRKDKFHEAKSRQQLGRAYEKLSNPSKAKENYLLALKIFGDKGYVYNVAVVKNLLSNFYNTQGDFRNALDYGFQSLKLSEQLKSDELIITNLNDLSTVFIKNREYDSALNYLFTARSKFESNKLALPYILGNIGVAYAGKKDYVNAMKYSQQSLDMSRDFDLKDNKITRLINLAEIYLTGHKYTDAMEVLFESLKLAEDVKDNDLMARSLSYLGRNYLEMSKDSGQGNRPDSLAKLSQVQLANRAIGYLQKAIRICHEMNNLVLLQEDYRLLAEAHHAAKDDRSAFQNFSQYIFYRDSIYNIDKAREQNKLMLQHEYDKQAAEKDKELALSKAAARFRLRLAVIIGSAIMLASGLFFYFRRKIERNKYSLEITSLKQQALNAQMSDHFISNTMDSINQFIKNNDKEKASEYLLRFHRLVRKVLENAPEKMIPLRDDLEVLNNYIELEKLRFTQGGLEYKIIVDEQIDQDTTLIPPMILQILAENAIKHGFKKKEGGQLLVSLEKKEGYIECRVEDNGSGRNISSIVQDNAQPQRRSIGGSLAEKLIKAAGKYKDKTYFKIIDLLSPVNTPAGTAVQFSLPYTLAD